MAVELCESIRRGDARGDPEAGDGGHVFRAGAAVPFLLAARGDGDEADAASNPQRPDALGTAELVGGEREQIHAEPPDGHGNLADRLDGVGVKDGAAIAGDRRQLCHGLDRADLIVGVHDRDDPRVAIGERRAEVRGIDDAVVAGREDG